MRVISGIYKRRRFDVPHSFKARPTTDFAKENLFNVLSNYMDFEDGIRALDLFAGTGSISIELVSRGCDQVISVEKDRDHYAFICPHPGTINERTIPRTPYLRVKDKRSNLGTGTSATPNST